LGWEEKGGGFNLIIFLRGRFLGGKGGAFQPLRKEGLTIFYYKYTSCRKEREKGEGGPLLLYSPPLYEEEKKKKGESLHFLHWRSPNEKEESSCNRRPLLPLLLKRERKRYFFPPYPFITGGALPESGKREERK